MAAQNESLIKALCTVENYFHWLASAVNDWPEHRDERDRAHAEEVTEPFQRLHAAIDEAKSHAHTDEMRADLLELKGLLHPIYYGDDGLGLIRGGAASMPIGIDLPVRSITRRRLLLQDGAGIEPTPPKRRPKRTPADRVRDEGVIAAYLTEHPAARRDEVADATGIAPAHVSQSKAWIAHSAQKRQARAVARPQDGVDWERVASEQVDG